MNGNDVSLQIGLLAQLNGPGPGPADGVSSSIISLALLTWPARVARFYFLLLFFFSACAAGSVTLGPYSAGQLPPRSSPPPLNFCRPPALVTPVTPWPLMTQPNLQGNKSTKNTPFGSKIILRSFCSNGKGAVSRRWPRQVMRERRGSHTVALSHFTPPAETTGKYGA
jgi:hypothetical protein